MADTCHRLERVANSWQRAIRDQRHKLIEYRVNSDYHIQLLDLEAYPDETRDLAADPAQRQTLERIRFLLAQERMHLNDGNSAFPFSDKQGKDFWGAAQ